MRRFLLGCCAFLALWPAAVQAGGCSWQVAVGKGMAIFTVSLNDAEIWRLTGSGWVREWERLPNSEMLIVTELPSGPTIFLARGRDYECSRSVLIP